MILHPEIDLVFADPMPLVCARGGTALPEFGIPPPSHLCSIEVLLLFSNLYFLWAQHLELVTRCVAYCPSRPRSVRSYSCN